MNIVYTCDSNYVWLMGISAISLFENNRHISDITVYLLGENISQESKSALKQIERQYNRKIIVVDVPYFDIPKSLISSRWPRSAFTRLYSGQLLPISVERVLYLDCDTIVAGDIAPLENIMMNDFFVSGVRDCVGSLYKQNIGLDSDGIYINAGVLLMDLQKFRGIDMNSFLESYMHEYEKRITYADQDVLNGAFKNKIGVLPPQYDVMTIDASYSYEEIRKLRHPTAFYEKEVFEQAVADPVIIHYTTNMRVIRPWFSNTNHPFATIFRKYMAMSPWEGRTLQEMHFQSKESKVIAWIEKLPRPIACSVLGIIHSVLRPMYIRIKL